MLGFSPLADNSIAGFDTLNSTVTGVQATGAVGTVSVDTEISVTGVQATGLINNVLVWGEITPSQSSGFSAITPSQSPSWEDIAA